MTRIVRSADTADVPVLVELDRHLEEAALADRVGAGRVLVVEVDAVVVGILQWGMFWDEIPFMNLLWLLPQWRGHGLGRLLVLEWEAQQLAAGLDLVLTSTVSTESAQHFYRKLGYVDSGTLLLPDEPFELILRKQLY